MALGKLTDDYKIFGRSDFGGPGPGDAFMKIVREWCRHGNRTNVCDEDTTISALISTTSTIESSTVIRSTVPYPLIPPFLIVRDTWGAIPPKSNSIPMLEIPIERIIIGHTGGSFCTNQNDCISIVRSIQIQDPSLDDIAYNFLIGGDGNIYEGRGFNYEGQHTHNLDATEYNSIGIGIAFIGNYAATSPNSSQIELLNDFIRTFVEHELIAEDHIIVSQDDLKYFQLKANALNEVIATVDNFRPCRLIAYLKLITLEFIIKYSLQYIKFTDEKNGML
jgi:N-acetylmuramoyl-L-alanine amidase